MIKSAEVWKVDGTKEVLDHKPSYEECQRIVATGRPVKNTLIEVARGIGFQMIVNEEGIPLGLPLNRNATSLYGYSGIHGDVIVLRGWRFT